MRFFRDDARKTRVEWYGLPDDIGRPYTQADAIPWAHMFGSRIYDRDEEPQEPIGEVYDPHPWRACSVPCEAGSGGLCGSQLQWEEGSAIADPLPANWPGTNVPRCCGVNVLACCGGLAIGRFGFGACHMTSTCDIYNPFGAAAPSFTNVPCQFVSDLVTGRGTSPLNTVAWTHYIDVDEAVQIFDGCTRTASLDTLNYADGDEVRIPTGGTARYVVVWVSLCDDEGVVVKRCYLMRHSF